MIPSISEMIPVLQTAIGPVILISGVGLLLLTMTNRLGRVIDRVSILSDRMESLPQAEQERKYAQLVILWKRARLIQLSIILTAISALFAAILVVVLFFTAIFSLEWGWLLVVMFVICMLALIWALITFIQDINQSLAALKLEVEDAALIKEHCLSNEELTHP